MPQSAEHLDPLPCAGVQGTVDANRFCELFGGSM